MNLMICKTGPRPASAATHADTPVDAISYGTGESALGQVLVARSVAGVCAILIGIDRVALQADLAVRFPKARLVANDAAVRDDLAKLIRFVDQPAEGLHLALDMRGTPFQIRVWEKLRAIPVGRTVTYMELARWISPLASARAVAGACAANQIALAIPCHRVVRSDGVLADYRWGIERKRELIRKEAMASSEQDEMREIIRLAWGTTSLGDFVVAMSDKGLAALEFSSYRPMTEEALRARFPAADVIDSQNGLTDVLAQVKRAIEEPEFDPAIPLDLRGTSYEVEVWSMLRALPSGETTSYGALAARLGTRDAREVTEAIARNPIAVLVPCHRVVKKDGSISGYRWGVKRKRELLAREQRADGFRLV
jgi:AraC family transcriptional regulator, regulatory protein of adaptative response / methylated-DNA-[protein]-cysteine methyltransferase